MTAARLVGLLTLILGTPGPAWAQGEWDPPLIHVVVEDRLGDDCEPEVTGACVANVTTPDDSIGNITVDAHHDLRYAGVAMDASTIEDAAGQDLPLPEESVGIDFSNFFVPYPIFRAADAVDDGVPWLDERHRLSVADEGITLRYHAPSFADPSGEAGNQTFWVMTFEERGVGYDGFRLVNAPGPWVSDRELNNLHLCEQTHYRDAFGGNECWDRASSNADAMKSATPSLIVGLHFGQAEVATDPAQLHVPANRAPQPAESVLLRKSSWPSHDARTLERLPQPPEPASPTGEPAPAQGRPAPVAPPEDPPSPASVTTVQQTAPAELAWARAATLAACAMLLGLVAGALYSRFYTRRDILASPARSKLRDLVLAEPGINLTLAAQRLGLTLNAVHHHARFLSKAGMLAVVAERHRVFLYPTSTSIDRPPETAFLRRPIESDDIVRLLAASPRGLTRSEIRDLLPGIPERTRNYRLKRLLTLGIVRTVTSEDNVARIVLMGPSPKADRP